MQWFNSLILEPLCLGFTVLVIIRFLPGLCERASQEGESPVDYDSQSDQDSDIYYRD